MADPLYELLAPQLASPDLGSRPPDPRDATTASYLDRLTTLSLSALTTEEPQSLSHGAQSTQRALQALSKRSHRSLVAAADHLSGLQSTLPELAAATARLRDGLPGLDEEAAGFAERYAVSGYGGEHTQAAEDGAALLERRRRTQVLAANVDRAADVLELPTLLSSAITASTASQSTAVAPASSASASYSAALDLHAHIRRLHGLYPRLDLVAGIAAQADDEMKAMAANLVASLQAPGVKLAGAMRTIGWLRRVAPELDESWSSSLQRGGASGESALGAVFLVCRLANLRSMLDALDPLRELADQETEKRPSGGVSASDAWSGGQQTERYLKRYIEIFREQSFAIISMYKSIFPSELQAPGSTTAEQAPLESRVATPPPLRSFESSQRLAHMATPQKEAVQGLPSALTTFPLHLVNLLSETLRKYLPNVRDRASRDSLLTQVLYCSGSLGRLGGDFGMMLALLDEGDGSDSKSDEGSDSDGHGDEWVEAMKKHRIQASRLELLAGGVGSGRTASISARTASPDG